MRVNTFDWYLSTSSDRDTFFSVKNAIDFIEKHLNYDGKKMQKCKKCFGGVDNYIDSNETFVL